MNSVMMSEPFFIGREDEKNRLRQHFKNSGSSLIAVIGRRRVGKTYFIKQCLKDAPHFAFTGIQDESRGRQLYEFAKKLADSSLQSLPVKTPTDWYEAFSLLKSALSDSRGKKKNIVFFDEFPWMDTHASGFLSAFEYFWNDWAVDQNIMVIICGSSTSWMIKNVMKNRSGLHNRVSEYFKIQPFTLHETEQFFRKKSIDFSKYDITQLYMAMGGIPHYLNMVKRGDSVSVCIDRLFFEKDGPLRIEYTNLYRALFKHYEQYELVIEKLAQKRKGLTRQEIISATGIKNGGGMTKLLTELEECSFIQFHQPFSHKQKEGLYRLMDEYSMFFHHFISKNSSRGQFIAVYNTPKFRSWLGVSFETLCIKHAENIKLSLGISGVYTETYSYIKPAINDDPGFQIDMLLDRADNIVNLCEMKFYGEALNLTQKDADAIRERRVRFQNHTKTKKNVMVLLISPFGVKENKQSLEVIDQSVTIKDLFKK